MKKIQFIITCSLLLLFPAFIHAQEISSFQMNGVRYDVMPNDYQSTTTWRNANEFCSNSTYGGYDDWTLPNIDQLWEMYVHQNGLGNFSSDYYWSSTFENGQFYGYMVINFDDGQSSPLDERNRIRCRCIRKSSLSLKVFDDKESLYGVWKGNYRTHDRNFTWRNAEITVTITPNEIDIVDEGEHVYKGSYYIKDGVIIYKNRTNKYGWVGSDEFGFFEIIGNGRSLGCGHNKTLTKVRSYSLQDIENLRKKEEERQQRLENARREREREQFIKDSIKRAEDSIRLAEIAKEKELRKQQEEEMLSSLSGEWKGEGEYADIKIIVDGNNITLCNEECRRIPKMQVFVKNNKVEAQAEHIFGWEFKSYYNGARCTFNVTFEWFRFDNIKQCFVVEARTECLDCGRALSKGETIYLEKTKPKKRKNKK